MDLTATSPEVEADTLSPRLIQSRAYCARLTREAAKNFYYGLKLLPEPKRSAMFALYAYMRMVDDIADNEDNGRTVGQRIAVDHRDAVVGLRQGPCGQETGDAAADHHRVLSDPAHLRHLASSGGGACARGLTRRQTSSCRVAA